MKVNVWAILVLILMGACEPEKRDKSTDLPPEEEEKIRLYDAAREVHDEVMPLIDSIFNSRGIIMEEIERASEGLKQLNEDRKKALEDIAKELEAADEAMFQWMRNHSAMPADSLSHEEIIEKLEESFKQINLTKEQMFESLEKAKRLIHSDSTESK